MWFKRINPYHRGCRGNGCVYINKLARELHNISVKFIFTFWHADSSMDRFSLLRSRLGICSSTAAPSNFNRPGSFVPIECQYCLGFMHLKRTSTHSSRVFMLKAEGRKHVRLYSFESSFQSSNHHCCTLSPTTNFFRSTAHLEK